MIGKLCLACGEIVPIPPREETVVTCCYCGATWEREGRNIVDTDCPYTSPLWLEYQFHMKKLTISQIAQSCGILISDLVWFLDRYGLMKGYPIKRERLVVRRPLGQRTLYFIAHPSGPMRIGTTLNLDETLGDLQKGTPEVLILVHTVSCGHRDACHLERRLHRALAKYHVRDRWYAITPEMLEDIKARLQRFLAKN